MLLQNIFIGIYVGSLYALGGLCFVIIFKTSEIINFAQADMTMLSMFVAFFLLESLNLPYYAVFFFTIVFAGLLAGFIQNTLVRSMAGKPHLSIIIAIFGVALIINSLTGWIWGPSTRALPAPYATAITKVGNFTVYGSDLLAIIVAFFFMTALYLFLEKTRFGMAMRATFQNRDAARIMGVPTHIIDAVSWIISGILMGVAGLFITPLVYLDLTSISEFMIKVFAAIILGGMNSFIGAVLGGLILGVSSNLVAFYISTELKSTFIFFIMITVLFIRPTGLFGKKEIKKI